MIDVGGVALIIIAILILVAVVHLGGILDWIKRDRVTPLLDAQDQAIRIANDNCGPVTPCSIEDNYLCVNHRTRPHPYVQWDHCDRCYAEFERTGQVQRGKHAAVWEIPLDDQPASVILAVVTDLKRRQKP